MTARVGIELRGVSLEGAAEGSTEATSHLVARAVAAALRSSAETATEVESATIVSVGRLQVAVAIVRSVSSAADRLYCGSAVVTGDQHDALARATVSAFNQLAEFESA